MQEIKEMIEVFKTNVTCEEQASILHAVLLEQFPACKINFDLEDCDRILRVEGKLVIPEKVVEVLCANGYQCFILE